jgi:outer membrane autotransporter protein
VQTGSVSLSAYSLGLNATVASQAGAYADLLLMGTRLAGVNANSPLGTSINTTGWALSGSIEGGWQIPMSSRVTITPQAQLYLTSVNLATTEDAYATIQMPTQTTTLGRLGLKLAYDNAEAGKPHTQFWVRASLFSTLSGQDAPTSFLNLAGTNPTTFHSQAPSTWMTIDAALNLKATDSTSVQLGLGYQTSFNSQYRGVYGQVNLRIGF